MDVADGDVLWEPRADVRRTSRLGRFLAWLEAERDLRFADYDALWRWSVADLETFWQAIWDHFGVRSATPCAGVLADRSMPGARWFPGATVNYAGHLLAQGEARDGELAVLGRSQTRPPVDLTWHELREQVARARAGLERLGVRRGDRVVGYLPNIPETVVAFLACASLGAVWASCATEFGPQAVLDRFGPLEPTVLLAVSGYRYGDRYVDVRERVAHIRAGLPSVATVVDVPYGEGGLPGSMPWAALTAEAAPLVVDPVPFDHPLFVLFSSGTTGLPKAIVHGHGGILVEHLKNHGLSWDLGPADRMMWFTTTAWMMWNAMVSCLLLGASVVTLDGNPLHPDLANQWRLAADTKSTAMGLSPAFIMACRKAGMRPGVDHDLSALRMIAAAGSPLPAEGFGWIHDQFGDRVPLNVGSGGTDVCTGLVQGNPMLPVYAGEISGRCLGVEAYAYDDGGNEVVRELGELVICSPMPSMPVRFWGDHDGARYRASYFEHYPGVMRFGDWIRFDPRGSCVITGRSDATLNRGGVRIGTAEIYRVVEALAEVEQSLVVHLEDPDGGPGRLVLFVVPASGTVVDDAVKASLAAAIREALSPRHVPDEIVGVPSIPHNLTGKKLELPVKKILQGAVPATVVSRDAMADPTALDAYVAYAESRRHVPPR